MFLIKKTITLLFIFSLITFKVNAQKLNYQISENANRMFMMENYKRAKELYRELYKENYNNLKNKYRFGVCLVYTYNTKDAITLLESIVSYPSTPTDVFFHLGKAYHLENNFDKAISYYEKYINTDVIIPDIMNRAKRNIQMCENAKLLMKDSLKVELINMGRNINTIYDEYTPYITPEADKLIFSTRRLGTTGRIYDLESYYTADIYISKKKSTEWDKAKSIGIPNSYGNEETGGMSENANYIFYYVNNPKSKNNLQVAEKSRSSYVKAVKIESKSINLSSSEQITATISNDGEYLIFSSNRRGGLGGYDLYLSKKIVDKKDSTKTNWDEPKNLGEKINTPYNDAYPYLINEGKTLLFASEGHNSMGGYDIFYTSINLETLEVEALTNIGYPINTTDDNTNISFDETKKVGYVSMYNEESIGNLDIYKVILNNQLPFLKD